MTTRRFLMGFLQAEAHTACNSSSWEIHNAQSNLDERARFCPHAIRTVNYEQHPEDIDILPSFKPTIVPTIQRARWSDSVVLWTPEST